MADSARSGFHPLEVFPWFRNIGPWPGREIAFTLVFNCGLSLIFWTLGTVFGGGRFSLVSLGYIVLVCNVMGFMIHVLMSLSSGLRVEPWIRARGNIATAIYYTTLSTIGILGGYVVLAFNDQRVREWLADPKWIGGVALMSFIISTILLTVIVLREREVRAEAAFQGERLRSERIEREAAHAQLRALQAQIEPHFLFNTLANVASLIDSDPSLSKRMLDRFIRFLRASLAATRAETTTLGAEGELIAAYLDVLQVRMESRLRYAIEIDPSLAAFALPPMLLQPVVENAIRHGVEPRVEGGEVRLRATREGDTVRIDVIDTGVGFAASTRGGTGLTNLRERLKLLHGERASLTIGENAPSGTIVTLRLPAT